MLPQPIFWFKHMKIILALLVLTCFVYPQSTSVDCGNNKVMFSQETANKIKITCGQSTPVPTPAPMPIPQVGIFVSTTGKATAKGTIDDPLDLVTAISSQSPAKPNDIVWIRGGTYATTTGFNATVKGDADKPVTIRAYPNERVILSAPLNVNSVLTANGNWVYYRDLEITCPDKDRTQPRVTGLAIYGTNNKFINLVVHDVGSGVGFWVPAVDSEIYGSIFFNNGWQGNTPDRGHGHQNYVQNDNGIKTLTDNIMFDSYGLGLHAYAQANPLRGITANGNIIFNSGKISAPVDSGFSNILIGGVVPADQIIVINNILYLPKDIKSTVNASFFFTSEDNGTITFQNNYVAGGSQNMWLQGWKSGTVTGNTFISSQNLLTVGHASGVLFTAFNWNNNSYFGSDSKPFLVRPTTGFYLRDLPGWQKETGYDLNSTYNTLPIANKIFIRKNLWDSNRFHLAIFNWSHFLTTTVNLSSVLNVGDRFEIRNVENYFGEPVLKGVYSTDIQIPTPNEFRTFIVFKL